MTFSGHSTSDVGTARPEFAADLLRDLYVRLRRDLRRWAEVTRQTPQPRMGYVGQHLVSVVTGFPGGRSGARGDDLVLPNGNVAEIKCCYRVDQLGRCQECGASVASIEKECPRIACGSSNIERKDDSKWLLTPKTEQELADLFVPVCYYLVVFEFADMATATDIDVRIYTVDPRCLGFSLCMIDYFFNIRPNSPSKASFNFWPGYPKFLMMKPIMIYWAVIHDNDTIDTQLFPGRDASRPVSFGNLDRYWRNRTFTEASIDAVATMHNHAFPDEIRSAQPTLRKKLKLASLEAVRCAGGLKGDELADDFARAVYRPLVMNFEQWTTRFAPSL